MKRKNGTTQCCFIFNYWLSEVTKSDGYLPRIINLVGQLGKVQFFSSCWLLAGANVSRMKGKDNVEQSELRLMPFG